MGDGGQLVTIGMNYSDDQSLYPASGGEFAVAGILEIVLEECYYTVGYRSHDEPGV